MNENQNPPASAGGVAVGHTAEGGKVFFRPPLTEVAPRLRPRPRPGGKSLGAAAALLPSTASGPNIAARADLDTQRRADLPAPLPEGTESTVTTMSPEMREVVSEMLDGCEPVGNTEIGVLAFHVRDAKTQPDEAITAWTGRRLPGVLRRLVDVESAYEQLLAQNRKMGSALVELDQETQARAAEAAPAEDAEGAENAEVAK